MTIECRIYVIAYSPETIAAVEDGYLMLDNTENPRPDWREYWPIRNFLLTEKLDEATFYGFFSPRFRAKTGLAAADVLRAVEHVADSIDVVTFSPQVDVGAFVRNGFVGSEFADAGSLDVAQAFIDRVGLNVSLREAVMDSRDTVFSNYFVARPSFWRRWLVLCEQLFALCEQGDAADPLRSALISCTGYEEGVQRKVFLMEGMISLILYAERNWRVAQYNPFGFGWSHQMGQFREEAIVCDALKIAARDRGFPEYLATHEAISRRVLYSALSLRKTPRARRELMPSGVVNEILFDLLPAGLGHVVEIGRREDSLAELYRASSPDTDWVSLSADEVETLSYVPSANVDAWVLLDSFGSLADPERFLARLRGVMAPHAMLFACVANLQHWSVVSRIVLGLHGLDAGDGRLYDQHQSKDILARAGFRIVKLVGSTSPHDSSERFIKHVVNLVLAGGGQADLAAQQAEILQYVFQALPDAAANPASADAA